MPAYTQNYANKEKVIVSLSIDESGKIVRAELSPDATQRDIVTIFILMGQELADYKRGNTIALPENPVELPITHQ